MTNFCEEKFEGFVYLDYDNLMVAWNIVRGVFDSPDTLNDESNKDQFISIALISMLQDPNSSRLKSELELEELRRTYYPNSISRLRGFFVFDEIDSIAKFWEAESWGEHFQDQYLSDVGVSAIRSSRLDSNWIKYIWNKDGKLLPDWECNAHSYWQGVACRGQEPIWERIVEGSLTIWSNDIRQEALKNIQYKWPNSLSLLNYACRCAVFGCLDGQVFAYMGREQNQAIIQFILRMKNAKDPIFLDKMNDFINKHPKYDCNLYNEGDIGFPDLSSYTVSYKI